MFILQQKQNKARSQVLYSKTFLPVSIEKNEMSAPDERSLEGETETD